MTTGSPVRRERKIPIIKPQRAPRQLPAPDEREMAPAWTVPVPERIKVKV